MTYKSISEPLTPRHTINGVRDVVLYGRQKPNTRRQHVLRRIPFIMCVFMIVRMCGVVLDTSICHSPPTAARITLTTIDSNRFVPAARPNAKKGNTQKGKKKGLFSCAPLQLPVIFYRPKNGENTCNVRRLGTLTHVLCSDP